jgi:Aromatic-ring-opening dioxygenase LigAB, LigA subunit
MSTEALQNILLEVLRSEEALAQCQQDPEALSAHHGLSAEELQRLKARDMGWLYVQGVHPYILAQFALSIRYDMGLYARQVREATGYRDAAQ